MFDVAIDGPLEYVKECLKVWRHRKPVPSLELMAVASPTGVTRLSLHRVLIVWSSSRVKDSTKATSER